MNRCAAGQGWGSPCARAAVAAWCMLVAMSCGGLSKLPSQGGPHWVEVKSESFVLYTDLSAERAREVSAKAEDLFWGLLHAGWPTEGVIHMKLNLVVLASRTDFEHFGGLERGGYYIPNALFEPMVVMPAPNMDDGFRVLAHELTHYISRQSLQNQPTWLSEGLAEYYETAYRDSDGRFAVGSVSRNQIQWLSYKGLMPTRRLMDPLARPLDSVNFYPTAWLLVHYLMSRHAEEFAEYQKALGSGLSHLPAWEQAFGHLDHAALDRALFNYGSRGVFDMFLLTVPKSDKAGEVHAMAAADVSALRGLLHATCPRCEAADRARWARADVEDALRLKPHHLRAVATRLMYINGGWEGASPDEAQLLSEQYPNQWLSWFLLAQAQVTQDEDTGSARNAIARALTLAPHQPYVLALAAVLEAKSGKKSKALEYLERIAELQPSELELVQARVALLSVIGECDKARSAFEQMSNLAHGHMPESKWKVFREIVASCSTTQGAPPSD